MSTAAPERIGRYELVEEIKPGALGGLWAARIAAGANEGKLVAVRRIASREGVDAKLVQEFCEAAWAVADLKIPGVLPVLDVVVADGRVGVVRDLVDADPLRSLMGKPMPLPLVLRVVLDTLGPMASIEKEAEKQPDMGVFLFGGLSPDRILIADDGSTSLVDLEFAGSVVADAIRKQDPGLLAWRAPELAKGGPADARSDQFTLGVLAWELITGRKLFEGESEQAVIQAITSASIPRLDDEALKVPERVPEAIAQVIERALQRDPAARFPGASEMKAALEAAQGVPVADRVKLAEYVAPLFAEHRAQRRAAIDKAEASKQAALTPKPAAAAKTPTPAPAAAAERKAPRGIPRPAPSLPKTPRPGDAADKEGQKPSGRPVAPSSPDAQPEALSPGKPVGRINIKKRLSKPPPEGEAQAPELDPNAFKPPPVPKFDLAPAQEQTAQEQVQEPEADKAATEPDEPAAGEKTSSKPPAAAQPAPSVSAETPAVSDAPSHPSKKKLYVGIGAAAAVLVVIVIALASGGSKEAAPPTAAAATASAQPAPSADPAPSESVTAQASASAEPAPSAAPAEPETAAAPKPPPKAEPAPSVNVMPTTSGATPAPKPLPTQGPPVVTPKKPAVLPKGI